MLIQYGQDLGNYLYDVFVAKFDFWLAFGLVAQLFFTARFLVQWISSERAGKSVVRLKGGESLAFGEVEALVAAGVTVEVVPGITSVLAQSDVSHSR